MKYDVAVTGPLVGCDYIMAEHLARAGLKAIALRHRSHANAMAVPDAYFKALPAENRIVVDGTREFLHHARQSRLIVSLTGSLIEQLRRLWPLRRVLGLPPVVNITTGSDISEMSIERSLNGVFYRQYLRFVDLNWCLPLPHALDNIMRLKVPNVVFMNGFPFLMPDPADNLRYRPPRPGEPVRLFHCSNFDWNYGDFGAHRNSTKGNDQFIRAFARAVKAGCDVELTTLDRGPDREVAKQMFERAGVAGRVRWMGHLSRDDFYRELRAAHVVVNMFAHGGAGGISFECLAMGVPVMQHAHATYFNLMYRSMAPFINCRSEDEIFDKIVWCCRTDALASLSIAGQEWVREHVAPENALIGFLFYYGQLTGDRRFDLGPHYAAMKDHVASVLAGTYDPYAGLE